MGGVGMLSMPNNLLRAFASLREQSRFISRKGTKAQSSGKHRHLESISAHSSAKPARWVLERQSPKVKQGQHDVVKYIEAKRLILCETLRTLRTLREHNLFHAEAAEFRRDILSYRHPERVSGPYFHRQNVKALKQVQGDDFGFAG